MDRGTREIVFHTANMIFNLQMSCMQCTLTYTNNTLEVLIAKVEDISGLELRFPDLFRWTMWLCLFQCPPSFTFYLYHPLHHRGHSCLSCTYTGMWHCLFQKMVGDLEWSWLSFLQLLSTTSLSITLIFLHPTFVWWMAWRPRAAAEQSLCVLVNTIP